MAGRRAAALVLAVLLAAFALAGCGGGKESSRTGLDTSEEIRFPEDHYPHPGFKTEWWYFTGMLNGERGGRYGYFCTFFLENGEENMVLSNMVDLDTGESAFEEFLDVAGDARMSEEGLGIDIGGEWKLEYLQDGDFLVRTTGDSLSMRLLLHPEKPCVINGKDGYMEMSSAGTSAYYSCTDMSTTGTVTFKGREMDVKGDSWLDRQWGDWEGEAAVTYDWFSCRFDDGTELMLYSFRSPETGDVLEEYNCGTYVDQDGAATNVSDFTVQPAGRSWKSEKTGETYPLRWKVEVPEVGLDFTIDALVEDQLIVDSLGDSYWEGACGVVEGNKSGYCYLEMDGYE